MEPFPPHLDRADHPAGVAPLPKEAAALRVSGRDVAAVRREVDLARISCGVVPLERLVLQVLEAILGSVCDDLREAIGASGHQSNQQAIINAP